MFHIARSAIDCRWSAVAYRRLVLESHTIWEDPTYKRTKAPALVTRRPAPPSGTTRAYLGHYASSRRREALADTPAGYAAALGA